MSLRVAPAILLLMMLIGTPATSAPVPGEVQAVLAKQCADCHGPKKRKGGLDLTSGAGIAQGGRNGPVVTPKKPEASRLWQMVEKERMPPDAPLAAGDRRILRQWIEAG